MSHIEFQIRPEARPLLESAGLGTFDDLMFRKAGEVLSNEKRAQTFRLELPAANETEVCFLKRTTLHRTKKSFQSLLQFSVPHTDVYREMQLVEKLREAGVSVMRILAWGEERKFGLPVRGFILTEGVRGESLHEMFRAGEAETRNRIAAAFGRFVAQLHLLGFFQIVRLKDLICSDSQRLSLTLIDRAACKVGRKFFWSRFCVQSLRRGFRRMKRDGITFEPQTENSFAAAYADRIASQWKVTPRHLLTRLHTK